MKKEKFTALLLCVSMLTSATGAFAHSGRTDSSGGHKDNKNKSGLGYYHYHCGGYPAHLHPNGVCPYKGSSSGTASKSSSSSKTNSLSAPASAAPKIVGTSFRTFINNYQIPTFSHSSRGGAYIIAEDMANYGFDISWNSYTNTVTIKSNKNKALTPMDMSSYSHIKSGNTVFTIKENSSVKVVLDNGEYKYTPASYDCGGYMAISADELKMFGTWVWDSQNQAVNLWTR